MSQLPELPPTAFLSALQRHRWLALSLAALGLGLPVGRSLRAYLSQGLPNATPPLLAPSAPSLSSNTTASPPQSDISDAAVEDEVARLLGAPSPLAGVRTPAELFDAIAAASKDPSEMRRFLATYEAVSLLGKEDIEEAYRRARADRDNVALRALERRWAEVDPLGAAKLWAEGKGAPELTEAFFSNWSKIDPRGALQWLSTLPQDEAKSKVRAQILSGLAKSDPQRAMDYASQMAEGPDRTQLITRALDTLVLKDPAAAFAMAKNLPGGDAQRAALDSVISKIAGRNPGQAQKLLAELPANTLTEAGGEIASALAKKDPGQAVQWAAALPEGQTRDGAFGSLASAWASKDVEGAAQWLDQLPKGSSRDAAVAGFASRLAPRDPEGATAWAATLAPGEQRNLTLQRTLWIWQRVNARAAKEWIETAPGFTDVERARLTQAAQQFPASPRAPRFNRPATSPGQ